MNISEYKAMWKKRNKYHAVKCKSGGITFDSKMEREYCNKLLWRQKAGEITGLEFHHRFPLYAMNQSTEEEELVGHYEADAFYYDKLEKRQKAVDIKGVITDLFKWKSRHFTIQYGIPITIVTKKRGRWIIKEK